MSYKFPTWVETPPNQSDEARASKRLRFILEQVCTSTGLLRIAVLARHCNVERTSIHFYIRRGKFSAAMAQQIEDALGKTVVRASHLTDPLSIKAK